jgi:hypothetical protein
MDGENLSPKTPGDKPPTSDLDRILDELAVIRSRIRGGTTDAVAIVREGREELERRGLEESLPPEDGPDPG